MPLNHDHRIKSTGANFGTLFFAHFYQNKSDRLLIRNDGPMILQGPCVFVSKTTAKCCSARIVAPHDAQRGMFFCVDDGTPMMLKGAHGSRVETDFHFFRHVAVGVINSFIAATSLSQFSDGFRDTLMRPVLTVMGFVISRLLSLREARLPEQVGPAHL